MGALQLVQIWPGALEGAEADCPTPFPRMTLSGKSTTVVDYRRLEKALYALWVRIPPSATCLSRPMVTGLSPPANAQTNAQNCRSLLGTQGESVAGFKGLGVSG
jgi:hypothetical protein